jgi:hypothetical protein
MGSGYFQIFVLSVLLDYPRYFSPPLPRIIESSMYWKLPSLIGDFVPYTKKNENMPCRGDILLANSQIISPQTREQPYFSNHKPTAMYISLTVVVKQIINQEVQFLLRYNTDLCNLGATRAYGGARL